MMMEGSIATKCLLFIIICSPMQLYFGVPAGPTPGARIWRCGDCGPRGEAAGSQFSAETVVVLWSICREMGRNAPVCPVQQPTQTPFWDVVPWLFVN